MSKLNQARQGDVLLIRTEKPKEAMKLVPEESGRVILAHGEMTGHAHALTKKSARLYETKQFVDRVLFVTRATVLMHEEHHQPENGHVIDLPKGAVFRVRRQKEYTPEEIRNVAD